MKTLKSIPLFCILHFMVCIHSNAQIVYTDVNPDMLNSCSGTCTQIYNLDLNNDGTNDFVFRTIHTTAINQHTGQLVQSSQISITPSAANAVITYYNNPNITYPSNVRMLSPLYVIDSLQIWNLTQQYVQRITGGSWNVTDKYVGLRINVGGYYYYGWVRISAALNISSASLTIKDYAYNTIANQSILAGQTCSPQAALIANGPLSFCSGGSVTLTSKNSGNTITYQWKKNNVNISGATNKNYTATTAGDYKVKVTDVLNSCYKISSIKTVTVPCRISNETFSETLEHISVFPNPTTNSVTIKFPSDEAGEIQIVNLFGRIVYSEKVNTEQTQIDVSKFPAGMYVVRWSNGENNETKTFSVIK